MLMNRHRPYYRIVQARVVNAIRILRAKIRKNARSDDIGSFFL
jgi:hypothetical protein